MKRVLNFQFPRSISTVPTSPIIITSELTHHPERSRTTAAKSMASLLVPGLVEQLTIMRDETKERLFEVNRKRTKMEAEMDVLQQDLRSPRGDNNFVAGLPGEGNLIDPQGFPRDDIDIYDVRTKRHRFVCLQTDHKNVMAHLEIELKALHKVQLQLDKIAPTPLNTDDTNPSEQKNDTTTATVSTTSSETPAPEVARKPFAKVESVGVDSPADMAGLKIGDLILVFGGEEQMLQGVPAYVEENRTIAVVVERQGVVVELTMTPKKWSGRGMLGCYLIPL